MNLTQWFNSKNKASADEKSFSRKSFLFGNAIQNAFKSLESGMRPHACSTAGFLGVEEKLENVLKNDHEFVTQQKLTHQQLASPFFKIVELMQKADSYQMGDKMHVGRQGLPFFLGGRPYALWIMTTKGSQFSPFEDGTTSNSDLIVQSIDTGKRIEFSALLPEMIDRYGFYEGQGTTYRLDPKDILEMFPFIQPSQTP